MKKQFLIFVMAAAMLGNPTAADAASNGSGRRIATMTVPVCGPGSLSSPASTGIRTLKLPTPGHSGLKKPSRLTASGAAIYGWETSGNLYELMPSGVEQVWNTQTYPTLSSCFLRDGRLAGPALISNGMGIFGGHWQEYDFPTGELLYDQEWNLYEDPIYEVVAYNPDDDCIYSQGQWLAGGPGGALFMKAPADSPKEMTVVRALDGGQSELFTSLCYNAEEKCLYGINQLSELTRISTEGEVEPLYKIDLEEKGYDWIPSWRIGITYSPVDHLLYFAPKGFDDSWLGTIDPKTGAVDIYTSTPYGSQLVSLITVDEAYQDKTVPEKAVVEKISFEGGATSGSIYYRMPEALVDGSVIEGNVTATVYLDNQTYGTYEASPGECVEVKFTDLSEDMHKFAVTVEYQGHTGRAVRNSFFVGFDTPSAPADIVLTETGVRWSAVEKGIHGGYVPASDMSYEVFINGTSIGTTRDTQLAHQLPVDKELDLYTATVVASYVNPKTGSMMVSSQGSSNSIGVGQPYNLPMTIEPTPAQAQLCRIIDANEDDVAWFYNPEEEAFHIEYNDFDVNDDWLILPPFRIDDAGKRYTFSFKNSLGDFDYPEEYLEVYLGTSPEAEAMTTEIIPVFSPEAMIPAFSTTETLFTVPEPGVYYIGIHMISEPEQLAVYARDFRVEDRNITDESPADVTDLKAVAAEKGALSATVSFNMPEKNLGGEQLAADALIEATVTGSTSATVKGHPGEAVSCEVETEQGMNYITVSTTLDGFGSATQTVEVYTGQDIPAAPENVVIEVKSDLSGLTISWDPVTEGENGMYIDPKGVRYMVYIMDNYVYEVIPDITDTSYTYIAPEGQPVHQATVGVVSMNDIGSNNTILLGQVYIGYPYTLPIQETFADPYTGPDLTPWLPYLPTEGPACNFGLDFLGNLIDGDPEQAAMFMNGEVGATGMIGIPYITTMDVTKAVLTLTCNTGLRFPNVTIYASYGDVAEMFPIAEIPATDGEVFTDVKIELPQELLGHQMVCLYIEATIEEADQLFMLTGMSIEGDDTSAPSVSGFRGIIGGKGGITVRGLGGERILVSDMEGRTLLDSDVEGDLAFYPFCKGIYVVNVGDRKVKTVVR